MMIRRFAELISRGVVIKRRLPREFLSSPIYVSPDSQLKYIKPGKQAFDIELLNIALSEVTPNSVVWDVGANIGVFTIASAAIAKKGEVIAIEADIWLAGIIKKSLNIPQNRSLPIQILPVAVSDKNGVASFMIANRGRASNSLAVSGGRSEMNGAREVILVPTLTLDTLLDTMTSPDFIKVDVEGSELLVLQGATRILKDIRPEIYIEIGEDYTNQISDLFHKNGYVLLDPSAPKNQRNVIETCVFNTLAVPQEKYNISDAS